MEQAIAPLSRELGEAGLALVMETSGQMVRPAIFPRLEGEPVPLEAFELRRSKGAVSEEEHARVKAMIESSQPKLDGLASAIHEITIGHMQVRQQLLETEVLAIVRPQLARVEAQFQIPEVAAFLEQILSDLIKNRLDELEPDEEDGNERAFLELYRVNVVGAHAPEEGCPNIVENSPTLANLIGGFEFASSGGRPIAGHMGVRGGSILRADGGYLILEALDVLAETGSWRALVRTLRSGQLEIAPPEPGATGPQIQLKPEPIPLSFKVILIGDSDLFFRLDALDPDFSRLFKVLAEFDSVIPRDEASLHHYASVIKRIAEEDQLPPFGREAVAALVEHGARIASMADELTSHFSRLADIAREAGFLAGKSGAPIVEGTHVRETVVRTKRRASLAAREFRRYVAKGMIRIQTLGAEVGQINGLAVMRAGPLTYGFPARITATTGPGSVGVINIERESELSGAIHTKGVYILGGLLRHLLRTDHPLAFDASLAFEQSYGGIDGDSASGAEACALLSALTEIPIRQDLAMTGAIDQMGNVLAVSGVNEKIEGFYDSCADIGLTGTQGVLIPTANVGELMLRHDVVETCREGRFHVYPVARIEQAMTLLMGLPVGLAAGEPTPSADSILGRARRRLHAFWRMAAATTNAGDVSG